LAGYDKQCDSIRKPNVYHFCQSGQHWTDEQTQLSSLVVYCRFTHDFQWVRRLAALSADSFLDSLVNISNPTFLFNRNRQSLFHLPSSTRTDVLLSRFPKPGCPGTWHWMPAMVSLATSCQTYRPYAVIAVTSKESLPERGWVSSINPTHSLINALLILNPKRFPESSSTIAYTISYAILKSGLWPVPARALFYLTSAPFLHFHLTWDDLWKYVDFSVLYHILCAKLPDL
jgi:hypothetical protein